tara:strand:- start:1565 stop:2263 length:699 start_codon:yes stop_codon:yes gene_type:complete
MKVQKNIKRIGKIWKFNKQVAENFNSHVSKSVPLYEISHLHAINISNFFLGDGSTCYDIGCSTGTLLKAIKKKNEKKKLNLIGLDNSRPMIKVANKKNEGIFFKYSDISKEKLTKSDFILSLYTIQFVRPSKRQQIFNKIYNALNFSGGFLMYEKIRADDVRFQDIMNFLYFDFKRSHGLSEEEIINKEILLRGVLEPSTDKENLKYLRKAGFKRIMPVAQHLNFKGYLAVK